MSYKRTGWGCASIGITYSTGTTVIYNEYLGFEIEAPAGGAQIRHLHIDPVLITNLDCVWHALVFQGKIPANIRALQSAVSNSTFPTAISPLGIVDLLYYSVLKPTRPATGGDQLFPVIVDFIDGSGPKVEAGQFMSVLICPAFLTGAAIGLNSTALITASVFGGPIDNSIAGAAANNAGTALAKGMY